jgi:hypothetical protein
VNFSSPKKPEPKVWSPSRTRAQKNKARPTSSSCTRQPNLAKCKTSHTARYYKILHVLGNRFYCILLYITVSVTMELHTPLFIFYFHWVRSLPFIDKYRPCAFSVKFLITLPIVLQQKNVCTNKCTQRSSVNTFRSDYLDSDGLQ